jgi:hypothetical protein
MADFAFAAFTSFSSGTYFTSWAVFAFGLFASSAGFDLDRLWSLPVGALRCCGGGAGRGKKQNGLRGT